MDSPVAPPSAPSTPAASDTSAPSGSSAPASGSAPTKAAGPSPTQPNSKLADKPTSTEAPKSTEQKAEERRRYKLKVDGAEQELELSDTEIGTRLQKALASEKRFSEAAEQRKAFAAFQEAFKKDPFEAAKHLSPDMDLDAMAEERLIKRFQDEELKKQDPAAHERAQLQKQIDEYKSKEQRAADEIKSKAQAAHDTKVGQEMERDFMEALEISGLPKDRRYLRMMAEVADVNLDHGIELTPKQMASEVNAQLRETHQHVTRGMKGESLVKHLGDDVVREVSKYLVEKYRAKQTVVTAPSAQGDESLRTKETRTAKKAGDVTNFFKNLKRGTE